MFKKIILAFKFSTACRSALEKAIKLAGSQAINAKPQGASTGAWYQIKIGGSL